MDFVDDILLHEEMELVNMVDPIRRPYNSRNRFHHVNNFDKWDDLDFKKRFRLSKISVRLILALIEEALQPQSNRNNPITPLEQLLITLRFFATGNFYISVADFGCVHKSTTAKIIKNVTVALARLRPQFIKLPQTENERIDMQVKFNNIAMFPRVLGALDCTHIRIQSPGGPNAEEFRNRKGFFSFNVQVICDANYIIRDIVARWPGSSHDANIFDNSLVRMRFENNEMGNGLLLADSAYPLRHYLITPLINPIGEAENLFNESLIRTRTIVERTFGIWKRRFPVLSIGMRCWLGLVQNVIVATAVLHNIARRNEDDIPNLDDEDFDMDNVVPVQNNVVQNENTRLELIDYFRGLRNAD